MIVDIFIPCFIDQFYPETGNNMVKLLEKLGCKVNYNIEQTCCGQPAYNAGYWDYTKQVGEKFIHDFGNNRYIVAPSGSCVSMVKNHYPDLFHNTSLHNEYKQIQKNIYELSDFIVNVLKIQDTGSNYSGKVTYLDTCQTLRECNIRTEPRQLLRNVKGLELVEMEDSDICCGFGGSFSVKSPAISVAMGEDKLEKIVSSGAEAVVSTDISCLMHLQSILRKKKQEFKFLHLADILASE